MRKSLSDDRGQVIVEYILMVAVIVSVMGVIAAGFRGLLRKVWLKMVQDISAPCPGCPPGPDVRYR